MTRAFGRARQYSVLCWNIGNPSPERAARQAEWLEQRLEDLLVLTEAKGSRGCGHLRDRLAATGRQVVHAPLEERGYGVIVAGMPPCRALPSPALPLQLSNRIAVVCAGSFLGDVKAVAVYAPTRDRKATKGRKRAFLEQTLRYLSADRPHRRYIVLGDLNVVEPGHVPHYAVFRRWEYGFYTSLGRLGLQDAFRLKHPTAQAHSWVGKTGNGYRFDHCFVGPALVPHLYDCSYLEGPRLGRLSDHSALLLRLGDGTASDGTPVTGIAAAGASCPETPPARP